MLQGLFNDIDNFTDTLLLHLSRFTSREICAPFTLNCVLFRTGIHDDVIKWKHFRVTGPLCGEFTGEFPAQRPVTRSFDVFFDLRLNKRLSKQP